MSKPIQSTQDYFPFGSLLPGRGVDQAEYKYGFNSKENDNEVYGDANFQDYGMRMYDTRVGRFVSVDPITKQYPELTPYQFASNTPIYAIDIDGLEGIGGPGIANAYYKTWTACGKQTADELFEYQFYALSIGTGILAGAAVLPEACVGVYLFAVNNAEFTIGLTGLTASLIDPNPNSDYPGNIDDLARAAKYVFKNANGAERFIFKLSRLDYFFGRGSGTAENIAKSTERLYGFGKLGIKDNSAGYEKIASYMDKAMDTPLEKALVYSKKSKSWEGYKVVDVVEDGVYKGKIKFGVSYTDQAGATTPEITTAIPLPTQ